MFAKFCWKRRSFELVKVALSKEIDEKMKLPWKKIDENVMEPGKIDEKTMRKARTSYEEDELEFGFGIAFPDIHPDYDSVPTVRNFWIRATQLADSYCRITMELLRGLIQPS